MSRGWLRSRQTAGLVVRATLDRKCVQNAFLGLMVRSQDSRTNAPGYMLSSLRDYRNSATSKLASEGFAVFPSLARRASVRFQSERNSQDLPFGESGLSNRN